MRVYTFKAEEELIYALDAVAEELGITRSEAIRRAIGLLIRYANGKSIPTKWRVRRVILT